MRNTYAQPVRDSYNNYKEIIQHRQYINRELAIAKDKAKDPNTTWLNEDEFWDGFEEGAK